MATQDDLEQAPNPYTPTAGALPAAAPYNPDTLTANAPAVGPSTYTPDDNAMVSSQLTTLLQGTSPYIRRAREGAMQYANSRGLLNSGFAAGAAEGAAIDRALPIASQDAGTHARAQEVNAGAANTFALDSNRFMREGALSALANENARRLQQEQQTFAAGESAADRTARATAQQGMNDLERERIAISQGQLANQTAAQALDEQRLEADRQTQSSRLLADLQTTYLDARTRLETDPNLDQAAKARAIDSMSTWYTSQVLAAVQGTLSDPGAWPDFAAAATPAAPAPAPWVQPPPPPPPPDMPVSAGGLA